MQYSSRNLLGYTTIVCIVLAIFRRPFGYVLDSLSVYSRWDEAWQCIWLPYWLDLYLLGLDDYWPFAIAYKDLDLGDPVDFFCLFVEIFSVLVWAFLHWLLAYFAYKTIVRIFFTE